MWGEFKPLNQSRRQLFQEINLHMLAIQISGFNLQILERKHQRIHARMGDHEWPDVAFIRQEKAPQGDSDKAGGKKTPDPLIVYMTGAKDERWDKYR